MEYRKQNGEIVKDSIFWCSSSFQFIDIMSVLLNQLFSGHRDMLREVLDAEDGGIVEDYVVALRSDFRGRGFGQYIGIQLPADFGSKNADEYISKALPMYSNMGVDIKGKTPVFWKGSFIPDEAKSKFFIVRIETVFYLKKGETPFVRYREADLMRRDLVKEIQNKNNKLESGWTVLFTSDIRNPEDGKWYNSYIDRKGNVVKASVILSLGREDFMLFNKRYDIAYLKILDGCYFVADDTSSLK